MTTTRDYALRNARNFCSGRFARVPSPLSGADAPLVRDSTVNRSSANRYDRLGVVPRLCVSIDLRRVASHHSLDPAIAHAQRPPAFSPMAIQTQRVTLWSLDAFHRQHGIPWHV